MLVVGWVGPGVRPLWCLCISFKGNMRRRAWSLGILGAGREAFGGVVVLFDVDVDCDCGWRWWGCSLPGLFRSVIIETKHGEFRTALESL